MSVEQRITIGRLIKESGIVNSYPNAPRAFGDGTYEYTVGDDVKTLNIDAATLHAVMAEYGIASTGDATLTRLVCALHALGRL